MILMLSCRSDTSGRTILTLLLAHMNTDMGAETIAMDRVGRLLLAVVLLSASACTVEGKYIGYTTRFHESRPATVQTAIFEARQTDPVKNKGNGFAMHAEAMQESGKFSVGYTGGMYIYHSTDALEYIVTITWTRVTDGIPAGSSINLRGLWREGLAEQELSIVGGQGGLKGASGTVTYTRIETKPVFKYRVECRIWVDDILRLPIVHVDLGSLYETGTELVHDSPEATDDVLKQVGGSP